MSNNVDNKNSIYSRKRNFTDEINQYKNKSKQYNFIKDNVLIINTNILEGISKNKHNSFIKE